MGLAERSPGRSVCAAVRPERLETVRGELCISKYTVYTEHVIERAANVNVGELMRCGHTSYADITSELMRFEPSAERPVYSLAI